MSSQKNDQFGFLIPNLCQAQALFVLIMASQLLVIVLMLARFGLAFDWVKFGVLTFYVQWQVMLSAIVLCYLRPRLARMPQLQAVTLAFVSLIAIGLFVSIAFEGFGEWFFDDPMETDKVLTNNLMGSIIIGISLRYLYVQQQMVAREKAKLKANLLALQARIRPHFLFNSLNSIASLISFAPDKAEIMIEDLAELIRGSLKEDLEVSFAEEWALCEKYLHIEKIRIGDRLQWKADFEAMDQSLPIPSLCLQPIFENAIYYGIQPNPEPGEIDITAYSDEKRVEICIRNTQNKTYRNTRQSGNQIAIDNIRHRLLSLYGDSAKLELHDSDQQFIVEIAYDYRKQQGHDQL